jgi:hypothetical protein
MKNFLSGVYVLRRSRFPFAAASIVPVNAVPIFVPKAPTVSSDVVPAQYRRRIMRRDFRRDRRDFRRSFRRDADMPGPEVIAAIVTAVRAIATITATGSPPQPSLPARSLAARWPASRVASMGATRMSGGVTTVTGRTAPTTIRTSPIMARAGSAIRPTDPLPPV